MQPDKRVVSEHVNLMLKEKFPAEKDTTIVVKTVEAIEASIDSGEPSAKALELSQEAFKLVLTDKLPPETQEKAMRALATIQPTVSKLMGDLQDPILKDKSEAADEAREKKIRDICQVLFDLGPSIVGLGLLLVPIPNLQPVGAALVALGLSLFVVGVIVSFTNAPQGEKAEYLSHAAPSAAALAKLAPQMVAAFQPAPVSVPVSGMLG